MPTEIERKRRLTKHEATALADRLQRKNYRLHSERTEVDDYYSRADVDFLDTVECLRIRRSGNGAEVTYKPATTSATSVDGITRKVETNVSLIDADQTPNAHQLLTMLDMPHLARVHKERSMYRHPDLDSLTVAIDTVAQVGVFVEVEALLAEGEEDASSVAAELLDLVERHLGVIDLPIVKLPYRDLVLAAC